MPQLRYRGSQRQGNVPQGGNHSSSNALYTKGVSAQNRAIAIWQIDNLASYKQLLDATRKVLEDHKECFESGKTAFETEKESLETTSKKQDLEAQKRSLEAKKGNLNAVEDEMVELSIQMEHVDTGIAWHGLCIEEIDGDLAANQENIDMYIRKMDDLKQLINGN